MTTPNTPAVTFAKNGDVLIRKTIIGKWNSFNGVYEVEHNNGDFMDGLTREQALAWFANADPDKRSL